MKPAVKWKTGRGGKQVFTIDVLAARDQAAAGQLSEGDRRLINRVLPGVLQSAQHKSPAPVPPCSLDGPGPKPDESGPRGNAGNDSCKPLKGHTAE